MDEQIERRTFVGLDGYSGFRSEQTYQLRFTREGDEVRIALDHATQPGLISVMSAEQFNKWFVK